MRAILLLIFLVYTNFGDAQVSLSRVMLNPNLGFGFYREVGVRAQFDRYFTVGVYGNFTRKGVGPSIFSSANPSTHDKTIQKRNEANNVTAYAGMSTPSNFPLHLSAMAGPSLGSFTLHENIQVFENQNGSNFLTSDERKVILLGLGGRADLTYAITPHFGINIGALANLNSGFSYYTVYFGLCIGILDWKS